jgi:hypothetical protein
MTDQFKYLKTSSILNDQQLAGNIIISSVVGSSHLEGIELKENQVRQWIEEDRGNL